MHPASTWLPGAALQQRLQQQYDRNRPEALFVTVSRPAGIAWCVWAQGDLENAFAPESIDNRAMAK